MTNNGLGLKAANERDSLSWWRFRSSRWGTAGKRPQLVINYTNYPSTATNLSVPGITPDGWVNTLTPTLTATPNSPDGGTCTANFQVLSGGTVVWSGSSGQGPCGQPQSVTVPAGVLGPLTQYQWRVNSAAGGLTSELATSGPAFRADAVAPGTVTITNPTFNNAAWNSTVTAGAATTFTIAHAAEDTDVVAYRTSFDGGPANTVAAAGANGSGTWSWTITPGWHELAAQGVDNSGNVSPIVARFDFGAAGAAMNGSHIDARSAPPERLAPGVPGIPDEPVASAPPAPGTATLAPRPPAPN